MYNFYRKDNIVVYVGKVLKITPVLNNEIKSIVLTLEHRGESVDIWFNNELNAISSNDMRADIIEKMNISTGSFLMVTAMNDGNSNNSIIGIRAVFEGRMRFDTQNLFIGTAVVKVNTKDKIVLYMPVKEYLNGKVETVWYSISFWNGSNENDQYATIASKAIGKSTKIKVAVRCGQISKNESNGKQYNNTSGYRLVVCY